MVFFKFPLGLGILIWAYTLKPPIPPQPSHIASSSNPKSSTAIRSANPAMHDDKPAPTAKTSANEEASTQPLSVERQTSKDETPTEAPASTQTAEEPSGVSGTSSSKTYATTDASRHLEDLSPSHMLDAWDILSYYSTMDLPWALKTGIEDIHFHCDPNYTYERQDGTVLTLAEISREVEQYFHDASDTFSEMNTEVNSWKFTGNDDVTTDITKTLHYHDDYRYTMTLFSCIDHWHRTAAGFQLMHRKLTKVEDRERSSEGR
jgi:hypothetical protein